MIVENNYSQIQHNFEVFNTSFTANQFYLNAKNQEMSQFMGVDIFQNFIEQNKLLKLIWSKFNTLLDDKKRIQFTLEEKVLEKNNILIQEQQNLIQDLQTENKNLKTNLEKVLRKIITKNTKFDIAENLYLNKNMSKLNLNTNNLLNGNVSNSNNPNSLSTTKSQKSLLIDVNNSKSKSKSKHKIGNNNKVNNGNNLKQSNSNNNLRNTISGANKIRTNYNDIIRINTMNSSIDESKGSNEEHNYPNANEKLNKMQFNLNKFIDKVSAEGVINKANIISHHENNDNLNMSVKLNPNFSYNNDILNKSHFMDKSYNIDLDRELNNLLNNSHNETYYQNNNLIGSRNKTNPQTSSMQNFNEKKITQNTSNYHANNHNGISSSNKNLGNTGSALLKGSQSMANLNNLGINNKKQKERDFSNTRGIKKDSGIVFIIIFIFNLFFSLFNFLNLIFI